MLRRFLLVLALALGLVLVTNAPALAACPYYSFRDTSGPYGTTVYATARYGEHKVDWQVYNPKSYTLHVKQCSGCGAYPISAHDWSRILVEAWTTAGCKSFDVWVDSPYGFYWEKRYTIQVR